MVMESLVLDKPAPGIGLAVGLRTYLEIVKVEAPSEASYGDTVSITIYVKNKWTSRIFAIVTGAYDTAEVTSTSHYIEPGKQRVFGLSFTMPNKSVNLWVWAWYWTAAGWSTSPDDEYGPVKIALKGVPPVGWQPLDSKTLTVRTTVPPVVGWTLLATKTLTVRTTLPPVVGWTLLATKILTVKVSAVPPPVGWTLLASKTLTVSPTAAPPVGWQLLDTATVDITAGPLPEKWELVEHYIDPWAYFWDGEVEIATAQYTLPPEEFPWTEDIAMKITESLKNDLLERGSHLLEWEVYLDRAGPVWSRWLIKVTGTIPPGTSRQIGWFLPWPLIIKGAFIIAALVIIYFIVTQITSGRYTRKELSEPVKMRWSNDTLIGIIFDLRPQQYPREKLEAMSHQELMDVADQVYKEEAPPEPEPWSWYVWLGIAGLGIAGSFVAVQALRTFAPAKKEKK